MPSSFPSRFSGALCAALTLAIALPAAAEVTLVPPPPNRPDLTFINHPQWVAGYGREPLPYVNPQRILFDGQAGTTIPFWSASFTSGSTSYPFIMVGNSPYATPLSPAKIKVHVFAYVLKFSDGRVYDPRVINTNCDSVSPLTRLFKSPIFNSTTIKSNGVNLGNVQFENAHERGEWYGKVKNSGKYELNLNAGSTYNWQTLTVPSNEGQDVPGYTCNGAYATVNVNWLENEFLKISSKKWTLTEVPVVLLYNVFEVDNYGNCCILGYHSGYYNSANQLQTFGVVTFNDSGALASNKIEDVHVAAHEFGELINDPTGSNPVPAWGHIGQTSGCQTNLEVGDPLTGTVFNGSGISLGGFTYHPQELVFFNWFTQSTGFGYLGTGGKYSMSGTFKSPASLCT